MQKTVLTIIGFGIAIALLVAVIVPLATQGHATGQGAKDRYDATDTQISTLAQPVT